MWWCCAEAPSCRHQVWKIVLPDLTILVSFGWKSSDTFFCETPVLENSADQRSISKLKSVQIDRIFAQVRQKWGELSQVAALAAEASWLELRSKLQSFDDACAHFWLFKGSVPIFKIFFDRKLLIGQISHTCISLLIGGGGGQLLSGQWHCFAKIKWTGSPPGQEKLKKAVYICMQGWKWSSWVILSVIPKNKERYLFFCFERHWTRSEDWCQNVFLNSMH